MWRQTGKYQRPATAPGGQGNDEREGLVTLEDIFNFKVQVNIHRKPDIAEMIEKQQHKEWVQDVGELLRGKRRGSLQLGNEADDIASQHYPLQQDGLDPSPDLNEDQCQRSKRYKVKFALGDDEEDEDKVPVPVNKLELDPANLKLTQSEYRRLSEQVGGSNGAEDKFRGVGFKRFYCNSYGENVPLVYRSQLAASLKAFKNKKWVPYQREDPRDAPYLRCRPVSYVVETAVEADGVVDCHKQPPKGCSRVPSPVKRRSFREAQLLFDNLPITKSLHADRQDDAMETDHMTLNAVRPASRFQKTQGLRARRRAQSAPLTISQSVQHMGETSTNAYDRLTPNVMYELGNETAKRSPPFYGEKSFQVLGVGGSKIKDMKDPDDTSGIDTSGRDSDISDDERIKEPDVDKSRKAPTMNLRPEHLDSVYEPDGRRDISKFDFDADNVDIPVYDFKYPLTGGFEKMDWRDLVETMIFREEGSDDKLDWRDMTKKRPTHKYEENMVDRLIEMERHQIDTEDWEEEKRERNQRNASQLTRQRNSVTNLTRGMSSVQRVQSAKARDRRCVMDCVQPACVGDCLTKRNAMDVCISCRQKDCDGQCANSLYESHSRSSGQLGNGEKPSLSQRPKSCNPCSRPNTAKYINANNVVLGRPKSGNATYSRGQASLRPKDLRPQTPISASLVGEFNKLGIDPNLPPPRPSTGKRRPRGRNAIIPGKTYFSQRRDSLTENGPSGRVRSAGQRRTVIKLKPTRIRPKTAV
ncbi:uncharacterized protein LOC106163173 isoform X2 [Lingula anatina]|uniref:Uncharacterized protein LOC106163173 isoform X2 n=1 Tax=Lingula anatina TaxID=7574 RepID=A0A1S3IDA3_LINAN|nr:uncharacterized protein LOC106163173 isoform X2 [Lingula anatina]|eukprot:XP_013396138.1 uncharacterized protein LOC106163173 isoform X2 [Lingula anatina]